MLDVKEAVKITSEHLVNLIGQDVSSSMRLEEVEMLEEGGPPAEIIDHVDPDDYDSWVAKYWLITLSYLPATPNPLIAGESQRQYKSFKINAETGELVSMKIRQVA
jgi:hypothetical protein